MAWVRGGRVRGCGGEAVLVCGGGAGRKGGVEVGRAIGSSGGREDGGRGEVSMFEVSESAGEIRGVDGGEAGGGWVFVGELCAQ